MANAETAEMTKLAETTYRDVNIALANEYARYAAKRGIDVSEVIDAANSQPYSHIHAPGVGVGGHCIPVYPHFLFNAEPDLRLPPLARAINEEMAGFAVGLLQERLGSLAGVPVLVLGIAYRADVREDAFSSAFRLRDELSARVRWSMPTTRSSAPSTSRRSASNHMTWPLRRRFGPPSCRRLTPSIGRSTSAPSPAWSCWSTVATRSIRRRSRRPASPTSASVAERCSRPGHLA